MTFQAQGKDSQKRPPGLNTWDFPSHQTSVGQLQRMQSIRNQSPQYCSSPIFHASSAKHVIIVSEKQNIPRILLPHPWRNSTADIPIFCKFAIPKIALLCVNSKTCDWSRASVTQRGAVLGLLLPTPYRERLTFSMKFSGLTSR